jgi:16S rRNA (guanine527-N7)-methyltransferase
VSDVRAEVRATHAALLERWRRTMDLVGPGPLAPHFDDAEAATAPLHAAGDWVDLGSGAGFPGVTLAASYPDARVTLVERREKRAAFLEAVARAAGLPNLAVVCGDAAALTEAAWDGVISRAYRPPAELLPEAGRLLRPDGRLVLLLAREPAPTGDGWTQELDHAYVIEGRPRHVVVLRKAMTGR